MIDILQTSLQCLGLTTTVALDVDGGAMILARIAGRPRRYAGFCLDADGDVFVLFESGNGQPVVRQVDASSIDTAAEEVRTFLIHPDEERE